MDTQFLGFKRTHLSGWTVNEELMRGFTRDETNDNARSLMREEKSEMESEGTGRGKGDTWTRKRKMNGDERSDG